MDYCFIPSSYIYVTLHKITLFLDKNNKQTHYFIISHTKAINEMRNSQTQRIKVVVNRTRLKSMLAAFAALSVATANAQTIKGVVTDADNGEPIIGATIKVKETSKAAVTDMDGKYSITGLTTGRYTIEASYIGYQLSLIHI